MRIRSIKPEFWRSQDVADLPREVRLLWIGLWSYVDDNGVGLDDYRAIAADLFALDDPVEAREFVRDGLATLSRGFQIVRYTVCGRSYLYINGWDKHQRVDKPASPRYPSPSEADEVVTSENDETRDALATDSRHPRAWNRGTGEQGKDLYRALRSARRRDRLNANPTASASSTTRSRDTRTARPPRKPSPQRSKPESTRTRSLREHTATAPRSPAKTRSTSSTRRRGSTKVAGKTNLTRHRARNPRCPPRINALWRRNDSNTTHPAMTGSGTYG